MHTAGQKMKTKIKRYLETGRERICSLLFPKRCPVCDGLLEPEEYEKGIHITCENKFYPIRGAVCMHCGRPIGSRNPEYCYDCIRKKYDRQSCIRQIKAVFLYKGAIKQTMYRFKYSNKREYGNYFVKQAMKSYAVWLQRIGIEVIVPVPMYKKKQKKRGYNQAECFARVLSDFTGIPVNTNLIFRTKDTMPQKALGEEQRKNNLKNAFHKGKNVVQYKKILVVDDIYTTGSTAEAVAKELTQMGTHQVYMMTICIGEDI